MSRVQHILSRLPDADDALRRLADVIQVPQTCCRRRACRSQGRCQGGFGPPCYLEGPQVFVDGVRGQMQEYREFWYSQHRAIKAEERRR
jgi:hypothetical protein